MKPHFRALLITFLAFSIVAQPALAQMCPNTNPETDTQMGCTDPFYTAVSKPRMSHGLLEFNITVKNRRVILVPDCNPGEPFCYDNINYQGLPLCQPWSGNFSGVKVELASCSPGCRLDGCPECDFNVTVTPSSPQNMGSEESRDFIVRVDAFRTEGEYDFTFAAFLSSVKKRVFSLHLNITSQVYGTGGDNAACPICGSEKCDLNRISCGYSCPGAIYCSAPECLFDTEVPEAAEYCCGDDSGEVFRQCSAAAGIDWLCPSQSACCRLQSSCAYSGNCYPEGVHLVAKGGEDEYSYCRAGKWHDCDESQAACSECGFSWKGESACCGDDSDEYFMSRICFSGCENNVTDKACCTGGSACVYNGECYATGDMIVLSGKNVTCEGGVWSEKTNESACYKGECNKKDRCEGSCPGCIFKDFSCYGTTCEPDFIDPDMHWSYCGNCSLNWSYADKKCCGDDENEYWVAPCPNANASWACCSNPEERVNSMGECVISCGIGINANASVLDEGVMAVSVSFSPEAISVQAGKSTDFSVIVRAVGKQTLHDVALDMCGPFSFQTSPQTIEELKPGGLANFSVRLTAGPDAAVGVSELAAYVSSGELIRQRYTPWTVMVDAGFPSLDFYIMIAAAVAAAYGGKRLLSRRKPSGKAAKGGTKEGKSRKESGRRRLAKLVREELDSGASEKELRKTLASHGLDKEDIEAAFREAKKKG
jgi:hypothetical protein